MRGPAFGTISADRAFGRELRQVAERQPVHDDDPEDLPVVAGEVVGGSRGSAAGEDERERARKQKGANRLHKSEVRRAGLERSR